LDKRRRRNKMDEKATIYGDAILILKIEYYRLTRIYQDLDLMPNVYENHLVGKQMDDLRQKLGRINSTISFLEGNDEEEEK